MILYDNGKVSIVSNKKPLAKVYAESVTILCPWCSEPIPAPDGSHQWTTLPSSVTCPECAGDATFKVSKKIENNLNAS